MNEVNIDAIPLIKDLSDDSSSSESGECMQIITKQQMGSTTGAATRMTNDLNLGVVSRLASISSSMRMRDLTQSVRNIEFVDYSDDRKSNHSLSSNHEKVGNVRSAHDGNRRVFSGLSQRILAGFKSPKLQPNRELTQSNELRKL